MYSSGLLSQLAASGLLRREHWGRYSVTAKGRAARAALSDVGLYRKGTHRQRLAEWAIGHQRPFDVAEVARLRASRWRDRAGPNASCEPDGPVRPVLRPVSLSDHVSSGPAQTQSPSPARRSGFSPFPGPATHIVGSSPHGRKRWTTVAIRPLTQHRSGSTGSTCVHACGSTRPRCGAGVERTPSGWSRRRCAASRPTGSRSTSASRCRS